MNKLDNIDRALAKIKELEMSIDLLVASYNTEHETDVKASRIKLHLTELLLLMYSDPDERTESLIDNPSFLEFTVGILCGKDSIESSDDSAIEESFKDVVMDYTSYRKKIRAFVQAVACEAPMTYEDGKAVFDLSVISMVQETKNELGKGAAAEGISKILQEVVNTKLTLPNFPEATKLLSSTSIHIDGDSNMVMEADAEFMEALKYVRALVEKGDLDKLKQVFYDSLYTVKYGADSKESQHKKSPLTAAAKEALSEEKITLDFSNPKKLFGDAGMDAGHVIL